MSAAGPSEDALGHPERWLTDRFLRLPDGTFPHLGIRGGGDVASVALLSGSPERVELMAAALDGAVKVGDKRGYAVYTGTHRGVAISVATSGVGAPSVAIAVEELGACGTRTFLRVGSCAAVSTRVPVGGLAISHAAVRDEGTSAYYVPASFPAVSAPRVVQALATAATARGLDVPIGLTRSTDSFYEGERRPEIVERWARLGVLTFEMEASCLFSVAAYHGWEAGSIVCCGSNLLTGEATYRGQMVDDFRVGQDTMISVALDAAAALGSS